MKQADTRDIDAILIGLDTISKLVTSWIEWDLEQRSKEGLSTPPETTLMHIPYDPSHGMLRNWVSVFGEAAAEILRLRDLVEWKPIESAPKDGSVVRVCRVFEGRIIYEGPAAWRKWHGEALHDPLTGERFAPSSEQMRWMYPPDHKEARYCVPTPTHWRPLGPPPGEK